MPVIAIEVGTATAKAAVFNGAVMLGFASRRYSYRSPRDGWAEQDPDEVWDTIDACVQQALSQAPGSPRIEAICASVQGDAIIPIDSQGRALHAAILGMDTRSHQEAADLQARFGRGRLYGSTGMPCEPLNAITKIMWLERNRPDLRARLWKYVHYGEFLLTRLCAVPAVDFTMASRTMAFDPAAKDWVIDILDYAGVTPAQLGHPAPSGVPIGIVHRSIADRWGIDHRALVVTGGHDQCIAAVGAGVIEPGLACYSMSTAEVIGTCFESPAMNARMLDCNYPRYCHAAADHYFTITLNQSGGLSAQWFNEKILELGIDDASGTVHVSPSEVVFLPHLVGSGTPTCDHLSRGTFLGLSIKTGKTDMIQAVADAQAFEARLNLETLQSLDIAVSELRAVGSGARNRTMLELKATVLNRSIRTLRNGEAGLLGAAMLAQVAIGTFPNLMAARAECVELDQAVEPLAEAVEPYAVAFDRYRQVFGTLKSFYHHWRVQTPALASV